MTVEEKLKTLYQLQVTLSAIDAKKALRGELPLEVEDLEDEVGRLKTRKEKVENEIADYQSSITRKRNEMEQIQESVERYKNQLNDIRNNREYDILTKEIESQNLDIALAQKKIREANEHIAELQQNVDAFQASITERQDDLNNKREELENIMQETREAEEELKEKAKQLEAQVEPRLLNSFKRIRRSARNGLGIVYVHDHACGGCFNKIPPQREIDIQEHKKIIVCEYCGRILIDSALAGVKEENPVSERPTRKRTGTRKKAVKKTEE